MVLKESKEGHCERQMPERRSEVIEKPKREESHGMEMYDMRRVLRIRASPANGFVMTL